MISCDMYDEMSVGRLGRCKIKRTGLSHKISQSRNDLDNTYYCPDPSEDLTIEWQLFDIKRIGVSCKLAKTSAYEEVVCKGYAMTRSDFEDLMLVVAVECCPLCNVLEESQRMVIAELGWLLASSGLLREPPHAYVECESISWRALTIGSIGSLSAA